MEDLMQRHLKDAHSGEEQSWKEFPEVEFDPEWVKELRQENTIEENYKTKQE